MSSVKAIKQRIANVRTTKKIMNAMDMVAASKLQKARKRLESALPHFGEIKRIIDNLRNDKQVMDNIFAREREIKNTAYIIITSDRGLCGSYNINIAEKALEHMNKGKNEKILVIGSKGNEYFKRRGKNIMSRVTDMSEARMYEDTGLMSELVASLYASGDVDEVFVAYTHFESTLNYVPRVERLLPVSLKPAEGQGEVKYEPNANLFLERAIPMYLHSYIYAANAESVACEHASRMINMDTAGKNAGDIIDELNRMYNRRRQAAITQELNEIIGGASILK